VGGAVSAYPARSGRPASEPLWARLFLPALAITTAAVVLIDLAATLSSLLVGRGIPTLSGGWVEGAASLVLHGGDPRQAWAIAGAAPPGWLLLLILAVLVGGASVATLYLFQWWHRRRDDAILQGHRRKPQGFLSAEQADQRFGERAARRDAARLHRSLSDSDVRRRAIGELALPLGRCGHFPVFARHEDAVAVVAGMRQGKTTGLLALLALCFRGPVLYTTTKPDDLAYFFRPPTAAEESGGRTLLFNPDDLGGLGTAAFDPTLGCEDPETAQLRARAILARQRARGQDRGLDWALLAEKMLKYLLHAAALEALDGQPAGMSRVVEWAAAQDLETAGVTRALQRSPSAPQWAELLREMGRSASETFYSIKINLHEALVCWEDPGLMRRVSPGASGLGGEVLDPASLIRRGDRLLVLGRPGGQSTALITALVSAVVEAARQEARRAVARGGRMDPPLLLLLDEVAKVCPLPEMPELVTDCASQGIVPVYALQSLEDGEWAWGATRFRGMWSATNCQVVMGNVSSSPTLRAISDLSPTVQLEEKRDSINQRGERMDPVVHFERALTTDEIQSIPHHTGVVFYGPRPMRVSLPHVSGPGSEVRRDAEASKAAWLAWAAQQQAAGVSA